MLPRRDTTFASAQAGVNQAVRQFTAGERKPVDCVLVTPHQQQFAYLQ